MKVRICLLTMTLVVSLYAASCPRPRTTQTIITCNPQTRQCTVSVVITWFGQVNEIASQALSENAGIFDLANPWEPDSGQSSYATVKVTKENQQTVQENFSTIRILTPEDVGSVDTDTTPYLYVFEHPNDVADFISDSLIGEEEATIDIVHFAPIHQADCEIPTDLYINHLRSYDGSEVTYDNSFRIDYSIPQNVQGPDACEQATITIAQ